jgi:DNA-binding response OmpR family regulator
MIGGSDRPKRNGHSTILVFDDEPMILGLLSKVLEREGYRVTATRDGDEAIELVSILSYDLALTDLGLRRRDGCRVVREIKRLRPETPILATTAYPAAEIVTFAEEHAEAFLTKPFGIGELLSLVRRVLDGRGDGRRDSASDVAAGRNAPALAATAP